MKIIVIILGVLFVTLLLLQFHSTPVNSSAAPVENGIARQYTVPPEADEILRTSCYDCHSDNTVYPWYAHVQPVELWLGGHIQNGKRHLNFDQFTAYTAARQFSKFGDIVNQIKEGEMPLSSYTLIHRYAILSDAQKTTLIGWAEAMRDTMKARYPADSLETKKK